MPNRSRARIEADAEFAVILQRTDAELAAPADNKMAARAAQLWSVHADQAEYRTRTERAMFAAAVRARRTDAH